jgi:hypothetical protein
MRPVPTRWITPMRRREFITLAGGMSGQMRRIGVLMPFAKDDSQGEARVTAFLQALQKLAWTEGRNLQIEYRWDAGDLQKAATELVALSPDVIFGQFHSSSRRIATSDPERANRICAG